MSETATNTSSGRLRRNQQMDRLKHLAETDADVYRFAFAWLAGAGEADRKLGEHLDKAIDYMERTSL